MRKKRTMLLKKQNKIKPENICRKNMKRIKIPGNNEFTQSTFHNPGLKTTGFNFCCVTISQKSKARREQ